MKPAVLALAGLCLAAPCLVGLSACEKGKPRHPPRDPMALATPAAESQAQLQAPKAEGVLSTGLAKRGVATGFFLDHAGAASDPRTRQPASTPAGQPMVFDGFAFDAAAKAPAKGVDVVVDGKAYGTAYGRARADVAQFFKAPALVNVGFRTVLPADTVAVGNHTVVVRVVSSDGQGYFDSPPIPFSVR